MPNGHIVWTRAPVSAPPPGAVVTTREDGLIVVTGSRAVICQWQLDLMRAGELGQEHLHSSGEGDPPGAPPVEISARKAAALASLEALPAGATLTQLRAAVTALKGA